MSRPRDDEEMIVRPGGVLIHPGRVLILSEPPREVVSADEAAAIAMRCNLWDMGPVLAVTDIGDAWRIFMSRDADWWRPWVVPWLVVKATGDLVIEDWP